MLGGKDFGGSQQRTLISGVDHLQHRQHRDDGLSRTHLALQQSVHGLGGGQFGRDDLEHLALARGQLEWQSLVERGAKTVIAARGGRAGIGEVTVAALNQRPLQAGGLVEGQPLAGTFPICLLLGNVNIAQRSVLADQIPLLHNGFRQRLGDRVQHVEHLAYAGVDIPALQFGAGWVDREVIALEDRHVQLVALPAGGGGDGLQRLAAAQAARG